jgi:hypothetical protein
MPNIVQGTNIWMGEFGNGARFLLKALPYLGLG